jgi:hypothetical protein
VIVLGERQGVSPPSCDCDDVHGGLTPNRSPFLGLFVKDRCDWVEFQISAFLS